MRGIASDDQIRQVALEFDNYFSGRNIHFFGMDYSGQRELDRFLEVLNKHKTPSFKHTNNLLGMSAELDPVFCEYRQLDGLDKYNHGANTDSFVAMENSALNIEGHTGRSAISGPVGIALGMSNGALPEASIYLVTTAGDTIGVSNFAAIKDFGSYIGVRGYMKKLMPRTYCALRETGMLGHISERRPETESYELPDTHEIVTRIVDGTDSLLLK